MLCEKCKNKQSTVFFTDTGGTNHSLCALCASSFNPPAGEDNTPEVMFVPKTYMNISSHIISPMPSCPEDRLVCSFCSSSYEEMKSTGEFGCTQCAVVLLDMNSKGHRMPGRVRAQIKNKEEISLLRQRLTEMLKSEDYEGAVSVRDKIRKIESQSKGGKN